MVLLRLRTDEGVVGLGEAVPLSLRGGATLSRSSGRWLRMVRRLTRLDVTAMSGAEPLSAAVDAVIDVAAGRRLPAPAKAAIEMAIFDLAGRISGTPLGGCSRGDAAPPLDATRRWPPGRRRASPRRRPRWAERGFATFKLKLGHRRRRRTRRGRSATRSARMRGSGSTPTAPGAPIEARGRAGRDRAARDRAGRAARRDPRGDGRGRRGDRDPDRRRRERRPAPRTRRRARRRPAPAAWRR